MDAAAPREEPKRGTPLIPPNYVSLRHLQELRLKEKEEQRQREEEAAAIRVQRQREKEAAARRDREEQRKREEEAAAIRVQRQREKEAAARRDREEQRKREEEAAARRVREEQRKREEDAARRVKEAAAVVPKPEMKAPSNTSFRHTERPRGGQQFVVVTQREPPPQGNGTISKNKDVGTGGYRGKKGPDGDAANASHGGGRKVENKGKEKVSVGTKGDPAEPATTPSLAGEPEEKRKVEALGYQGTSSGTSDVLGEPTEAPISSSQRSVRTEYKAKGKKGSSVWSIRTATVSEPADASPMQGVKSANKGKKKPSEGRCLDVVPTSDLPDMKSLQPSTAMESSRNRRWRRGSQRINPEAKSEGPEKKQPVVEVKAQPCPPVDGISNSTSGGGQGMNLEATSEGPGKKQPGVDVRVQPHPDTEGSSNRRGRSVQGTIKEAKAEGLGEKQPVMGVRAMARRKPRESRSSASKYGTAQQHGMAWIPKPAVVKSSEEVE